MTEEKGSSWEGFFSSCLAGAVALALTLVAVPESGAQAMRERGPSVEGASYVSSKNCEICHKKIYQTWNSTLHRRKILPADETTVVGDFYRRNTFTVERDGKKYTSKMFKKGKEFFIETTGADGQLHTYKAEWVIGTTWKQRYVTLFPNGGMHILPIQWDISSERWSDYQGLKGANYDHPTNFWASKGRTWQDKCGSCHVTGLSYEYDAKNHTYKNTTWVDNGAGCEACHGPGSNHMAAPTEEARRNTILNPANMPPFIGAQVCGQCHTRGYTWDGKYEYPKGYIPGRQLFEFYQDKAGIWPGGEARQHHQQYIDWMKSKHADVGVSCWTCHSVHDRGKTERFALKKAGDALCMDCHKASTKTGQKTLHSIHDFGGCIGCHMPRTAASSILGDISLHTFKVVHPATSIKAGGVEKQPNSCNLCHYHKKDPADKLQLVMDKMKEEYYK